MPRVANPRARLYRKRGLYYVDLRFKGRRARVSCYTDKLGEAERIAERELAAFRASVGLDQAEDGARPSASYPVGDAIADWLRDGLSDNAPGTVRMYKSKGGTISDRIGKLDCRELRPDDVRGYLDWRREEHGTKEHTLAKELTTLRRALTFAEERGIIGGTWRASFPRRFKTGYQPRTRWLTLAEYRALLAAVEPCRRLWVQVACYTGGRVSELELLDWRDVDFRLGFVTLSTAKTRHGEARKPRHIPMAAELRKALKAARGIGPVFPEPWQNPALMLTKTARAHGIIPANETLNDNDLRRTFASWMLQRGASVKEVADLLGHSSTAMVEKVYGHLARANLRAAVRRLPRFR